MIHTQKVGTKNSHLIFVFFSLPHRWSPLGVPRGNAVDNMEESSSTTDAYWYMGNTQTFRANIAFSLYGILAGEKDRGCRKATFINSFFTRYGVQSFVQSMRLKNYLEQNTDTEYDVLGDAGQYNSDEATGAVGFSSVCAVDNANDEDDQQQQFDESGQENSNVISYSLGCGESDHGFQLESFRSSTCNSLKYTGSFIKLREATTHLETVQCAVLYDRNNDAEYEYDRDDMENNSNNNNNNGEENEMFPDINNPLDLLKYSESCSIIVNPVFCPDPYGRLKTYVENLYQGTGTSIVHERGFQSFLLHQLPSFFLILCGASMLYFAQSLISKSRARINVPSSYRSLSSRPRHSANGHDSITGKVGDDGNGSSTGSTNDGSGSINGSSSSSNGSTSGMDMQQTQADSNAPVDNNSAAGIMEHKKDKDAQIEDLHEGVDADDATAIAHNGGARTGEATGGNKEATPQDINLQNSMDKSSGFQVATMKTASPPPPGSDTSVVAQTFSTSDKYVAPLITFSHESSEVPDGLDRSSTTSQGTGIIKHPKEGSASSSIVYPTITTKAIEPNDNEPSRQNSRLSLSTDETKEAFSTTTMSYNDNNDNNNNKQSITADTHDNNNYNKEPVCSESTTQPSAEVEAVNPAAKRLESSDNIRHTSSVSGDISGDSGFGRNPDGVAPSPPPPLSPSSIPRTEALASVHPLVRTESAESTESVSCSMKSPPCSK